MKNRLQRLLVGACILVSCVPALAEPPKDTLLQLYHLAQERDPASGIAGARFDASNADIGIAFAALMPRIDASASTTWYDNTTLNYTSGDIKGNYRGHNYSIAARVPLFNLPAFFSLSAAKAGSRSSESNLKAVQQDLIIRLAEAYFSILKAQSDERLYRDELKRYALILEQAQAYLKAGTGDVIAVYEAKARMDTASSDLVKATNHRLIAEQKLSGIVGRPVSEVTDLASMEPQGPDPADMQWWLDCMRKNQPVLSQARESLSQAEQQRRASKAAHLPTLQATGGYADSKGSTFLPDVETRQWYGGLSISFPLYTGGDTSSRAHKSIALENEQRFNLEDKQEQTTQKLKESYLNLKHNLALIDSLRQKQASAEMQLAAVTKGRNIGTRTVVDLLNTEQTCSISRRDLTNGLYDNVLYRLSLKAAAGILSEDDLVALIPHFQGAANSPADEAAAVAPTPVSAP